MYNQMAPYYDLFFTWKDYEKETEMLAGIIDAHFTDGKPEVLDAACGTGKHIEFLKKRYPVIGLDLSADMVSIAQERNPDVTFFTGDIIDFKLEKKFDVITCLFSSIGYVKTLENLRKTIENFSAHLKPNGLILIEPWFTPEHWQPSRVHNSVVEGEGVVVVRMNTSSQTDNISWFDLHYLIGDSNGITHHFEHVEMGLFTVEETLNAIKQAGLKGTYYKKDYSDRGFYIIEKTG